MPACARCFSPGCFVGHGAVSAGSPRVFRAFDTAGAVHHEPDPAFLLSDTCWPDDRLLSGAVPHRTQGHAASPPGQPRPRTADAMLPRRQTSSLAPPRVTPSPTPGPVRPGQQVAGVGVLSRPRPFWTRSPPLRRLLAQPPASRSRLWPRRCCRCMGRASRPPRRMTVLLWPWLKARARR